MRISPIPVLMALVPVALAAASSSASSLAEGYGSEAAEPITIDSLYSSPSIIGTAPGGVSWSGDSGGVAFLWNDAGEAFRDVWVVDVEEPTPVRRSRFPRPEVVVADDPVETLRRQQAAESHPGVTDVTWFPDDPHLLATFGGELYRVGPDGETFALGIAGRGARFSPDGGHLSWIREGEVWLAPVREGELGPARRLTALAGGATGVIRTIWSPEGGRLAVIVRDAGEVAERAIPDYLAAETTVDLIRRAFPGEEPARTRLYLVGMEDGASRRLLEDEDDRDPLFSVDWSPDGDRLLIDKSDLYVKDRRLLAVDADGGEETLLVRERERANVMAFWSAAWGADGESVYFVSDREDFYHLYRVDGPGEEPRAVTSGRWAVADFHVGQDALYVVTNRGHPAERRIERVSFEGGEPERLSERSGTHDPAFSPDGRWAAVSFSSDETPPDLFLNRLDERGEERVTRSPLPEFYDTEWVVPQYVSFPSHVDGVTIHGRLMLPPDHDPSRRHPAIIGSIYSNTLRNQWGGRNAHPTWGLDQVLLRRGYVLLNVNIRGSWGLGRAFRRAMQRDYGGIDVEDVYSGVRYLRSRGDVDMDRVGIWGSSYGGLLTAMSLFKHPEAYAAGVAGAPATNVWHATTGEMRVMGRPQDDPDAYVGASAFTWAEGLEDPLMIVHGMRDRIVLFKDSVVLLERLMLLDKGHLVDFVPLPDSRHGWDAEELYQTRYAFKKMVAFFDRHLEPKP